MINIRQQIIDSLGQEDLKNYFEDRIDVRKVYEMMDIVLDALEITEDDILTDDGSALSDNFPNRPLH